MAEMARAGVLRLLGRSSPRLPPPSLAPFASNASGHLLTLTKTPAGGTPARYNYGIDAHGSVSLLIDPTGAAVAAYAYTPYGAADSALTKGDADLTNPLNLYRYSAKRLDAISGSYDMVARRFAPDSGRFLQPDRYQGALSDLGLALDPQAEYGAAPQGMSGLEQL